MSCRFVLPFLAFAMIVPAAPGEAQTSRQPSPRQGVLGIQSAVPKPIDRLNGRKRVIYDADGRRDYRRSFDQRKAEDRQRMMRCQQYPADTSCFGRRF